MDHRQAAGGGIRKRRAETNDSDERLHKVSKRLSQLHLGIYINVQSTQLNNRLYLTERNGRKLGVSMTAQEKPSIAKPANKPPLQDDQMRLDDTPNKVYIYNLDDELSDSDAEEGKIIFLPDIEKRLLDTRIPPSVLANKDGELAGRNIRNELVLYNVPTSLTVPAERDSVRKAIIEARARVREKQRLERESAHSALPGLTNGHAVKPAPMGVLCTPNGASPVTPNGSVNGIPNGTTTTEPLVTDLLEYDPDAMDLS
jgi:hypothetical protein